ncbi:SIR2 family NAD-dependent protein deacylase [Paenibacillus medicaginis]|uniref:SIR2 family protein n=1 Tax=Paenibacillus medicaginis TaxID=1470560 RepID=A0ABV5C911_9BACL
MSLTELVNSVTTELNVTEVGAGRLITTLVKHIGKQDFTKSSFIKVGLSDKDIKFMINELQVRGYVDMEISYECRGGRYTSNDFPVTCENCGVMIKDSDHEHEYDFVYSFTNEFINEVQGYNKQKVFEYLHPDYVVNYYELKSKISTVVPFLGAGVSAPFGLPTWTGMLESFEGNVTRANLNYYRRLVSAGNVFEALTFLTSSSTSLTTEASIQKAIASKFANPNLNIPDEEHFMNELVNLDSPIYLTSNYDNILPNFFKGQRVNPILLNEVEDVRSLIDSAVNRVVHIHGYIDRPSTMIVTKKQYDELYTNEGYKAKLNAILAQRHLLFIGWSFADEYFSDLYSKLVSYVGGEHYMFIENPVMHQAQKFGQQNLKLIGLNIPVDDSGYSDKKVLVQAIKTVLDSMV